MLYLDVKKEIYFSRCVAGVGVYKKNYTLCYNIKTFVGFTL